MNFSIAKLKKHNTTSPDLQFNFLLTKEKPRPEMDYD